MYALLKLLNTAIVETVILLSNLIVFA